MELRKQAEELARELETASPIAIIKRAIEHHGAGELAIAFSGSEDVVLIEHAHQISREFRVFVLDTGRLPPETYRFFDRVERHYKIRLELCFPRAEPVEALVRRKGLFSFFEDGHQECCGIRKVEPLRRKLTTLRGWITGQRRDQSSTRSQIPVVEVDEAHIGSDGNPVLKWNPLAGRTGRDVWDAIRAFDVPYNELHERGYVSIGCAPCTRATLPGQHEREGRWWWEQAENKECGLHEINLPSGSDEAK